VRHAIVLVGSMFLGKFSDSQVRTNMVKGHFRKRAFWASLKPLFCFKSRLFCSYTGELINGDLYGNDTYLYEIVRACHLTLARSTGNLSQSIFIGIFYRTEHPASFAIFLCQKRKQLGRGCQESGQYWTVGRVLTWSTAPFYSFGLENSIFQNYHLLSLL
jgi:hypothetical protein